MIVLFRTMTAPNGPPLFVRIFSSASATARCMNTCSVMTILDPLTRRMPQVDAELMTEKQVLGYRGSSRLQASPPNHALILPNDANPGRMQFSERTGFVSFMARNLRQNRPPDSGGADASAQMPVSVETALGKRPCRFRKPYPIGSR